MQSTLLRPGTAALRKHAWRLVTRDWEFRRGRVGLRSRVEQVRIKFCLPRTHRTFDLVHVDRLCKGRWQWTRCLARSSRRIAKAFPWRLLPERWNACG